MPSTRQTYPIEFKGGLVTNMSPLQQGINAPGSARTLRNFEPSIEGGYRRILGYTKYNSSIIPPYGAPVVHGASQSGTTLIIGNIHQTPEAGDTLTVAGITGTYTIASGGVTFDATNNRATLTLTTRIVPTAVVNGVTTSSTAVVLDGNDGTIVAGQVVTGTGISGTVTVASVTDQNNIVLSSAQTLSDNVTLTFGSSPANAAAVTFATTTSNYLMLGCGVFLDRVIVAKNDDLFKVSSSTVTHINVPNYGTVLVNGASQTGSSLIVDGLTAAPQAGDVFKVAGIDLVYTVTADATVSSGGATLAINPALDSATADVNGTTSSTTTLVVDNNSGTIKVGMTVTGTGISGNVTVASLSDQNNLVLSSAQSLSDGVTLTFSAADNAAITFLSTSRESAGKTRFSRYNYTGTEKIAIVDGTNVPALYDNTTFTALNACPTDVNGAGFVVNFKNQLFFGKSNLLTFTAPYTDNDFTAAAGSGTISLGAVITGLIVFRQQLIIFTESSIFQLVGNTISDFQLQPVTTDIGCVDTDTIQEVGGDIMFLGPDGLRLLSGTDRIGDFGLGVVSKAIQKEVTSFITANTSFASVVIRNKSQYRILGYNTNITQENAQGILGTQFSGQGGEGMAWGELRGIRAYVADSRFYQNVETIVFANDDGYLYQMEDGNSFDSLNIQTTFATPFMPVNDPRIRKTFYKSFLYTDPQGSVSFDMSLKLDFDQRNSVQPTQINFDNNTGVVAFYGSAKYGSTAVFSNKLLTLFETQLIGSGFTASIQFESDSTDPPFSLDAITLEFGTNTRR